jgi:hypothetical protein
MKNTIDFTTLTDEELCEFHTAFMNEAKRRVAIRKRQALIHLRDALGEFLKEGVHYECDKYIELEVANIESDEYDTLDINVFSEEILVNMKEFLDKKVGNYTGE